jgi:hypothetical protein
VRRCLLRAPLDWAAGGREILQYLHMVHAVVGVDTETQAGHQLDRYVEFGHRRKAAVSSTGVPSFDSSPDVGAAVDQNDGVHTTQRGNEIAVRGAQRLHPGPAQGIHGRRQPLLNQPVNPSEQRCVDAE